MAIYHLSTKPISRSSGRSAVAAAAYRSGSKITNNQTGEVFDYTKKSGIVYSKIITPEPNMEISRDELWNLAEQSEKRKDSRIAREIVIALPHESHERIRQVLAEGFAKQISTLYGCAVDLCIHEPSKEGDDRNHHAHLLLTTRKLELNGLKIGLGDKTDLELSDTALRKQQKQSGKEQINLIRGLWEANLNQVMSLQNQEFLSSKSHFDRGLSVEPTIKMGVVATAMERKGIKTARGDVNREILYRNTNQPIKTQPEPFKSVLEMSIEEALIIKEAFEEAMQSKTPFRMLGSKFQAEELGIPENQLIKARQMVWELEEKQQELSR